MKNEKKEVMETKPESKMNLKNFFGKIAFIFAILLMLLLFVGREEKFENTIPVLMGVGMAGIIFSLLYIGTKEEKEEIEEKEK